MILKCNSCEKKFVVPDKAITASGRLVQCGSCGNKWREFPVKKEVAKVASDTKKISKKTMKSLKSKNKREYLAKKHGISLDNDNANNNSLNEKISFGFYNSLILFIVTVIALSKGLHFF